MLTIRNLCGQSEICVGNQKFVVDNKKFVLTIRNLCYQLELQIKIIVDMYESIKVLFQIYMVTIKCAVTF